MNTSLLIVFSYLNFSGEKHFPNSELVGSPRNVEGHEVRLVAIVARNPQTSSRETSPFTLRRITGKHFHKLVRYLDFRKKQF